MANHPKMGSLLGVKKPAPPVPVLHDDGPAFPRPNGDLHDRNFSFALSGDPMGKPRMTQRDKWMKRPVVLRYRQYCDDLRAAAAEVGPMPERVYGLRVVAFIAFPPSYSKKKRDELRNQMHQLKPDWDNIGKAVSDALFAEDSVIADAHVRKYWCDPGQERTEVRVLYIL